ncbi:TnsD family Tn7-like transposition protein [Alkaliphilus oremlandii]|uniref:TnsD family Tn7-like transposition protein n=1 Tax=Alkaliphilus oremlandii TaxID=461876 RepID=UPI0000D82C53|nr:TnsD family Tn7-like transposition protein [Alkaliphilus oremlandii]
MFTCPHNEAKLKKYDIDKTISSRVAFIRLDERYLDFNVEYEENERMNSRLLEVSKAAYYILTSNIFEFDKDTIFKKYKELLDKEELLSVNKNIKQRELHEEFINFYGEEFLEIMESGIDKDNEYNPFGKSPWPCLNPVADHYKQDIIYNFKITSDYKTRKPVGTFTCDCGFIYSRKGPDTNYDDRYKVGRVKNFGYEWEDKLKKYLNLRDYSIRDIAKLMKCDPKTVVKYDKYFGINRFKDSKMNKLEENIKLNDSTNIDIELYKNTILDSISNNPNLPRTNTRELCKKEYNYIYKHDRKWLSDNLPKKLNRKQIDNKSNERVDWNKRDIEVLNAGKNEYLELISKEKPIRITMSNLGKVLGILPMH